MSYLWFFRVRPDDASSTESEPSTNEGKGEQSNDKKASSEQPQFTDQLLSAVREGVAAGLAELPNIAFRILTDFMSKGNYSLGNPVWDPHSVVDQLKSRGQPSDFQSRASLYKSAGFGDGYSGTGKENDVLRTFIQKRF